MPTFDIEAIGFAKTAFAEKFGIPRQANLVDIPAELHLHKPYASPEAVEGLQSVSHIWVHFIFHQHFHRHSQAECKLSVRPPRLGGNKQLGVFATRSSFRPNALGQSLVKLTHITHNSEQTILHIAGADFVTGTPIVDIKPYVPYADCIPEASNEWAAAPPQPSLQVIWRDQALAQLSSFADLQQPASIKRYIDALIALDPRPAYKRGESTAEYGMQLFDMNIRWMIVDIHLVEIIDISLIKESLIKSNFSYSSVLDLGYGLSG